jgi:phospholipid/cholesterol/gamma-HCH transport system substrate-binding protein
VSRSLTRWQALWLGVIFLLALGLASLGVFAVGSRGWYGTDALQVRAGFPEIRGVEVGTRVRVQGIDAGEVVAILPPESPGAPVLLRLRIKGEHRHLVLQSSVVQIVSEGMLGGKVVEIRPPAPADSSTALESRPAQENDLLRSEAAVELADLIGEARQTLRTLQQAKGSLNQLGEEAARLLRNSNEAIEQGKETMTSIQRSADALNKMPVIRGYVQDTNSLLLRSDSEINSKIFQTQELFEDGRAVLSYEGKRRLDEVGAWANSLKHKNSEVVVVSYADPTKVERQVARTLTQQQSEVVANYLKTQHKIHKMSWFNPWSTRKVTALGQGTASPPVPPREPLPASRVEILVIVPQG